MTMIGGPNLFDYLDHPDRCDVPLTIQERFDRFHAEHPEVMESLVALTAQAVAAGATKLGIKMLWEVLRWQRTLAGVEDSDGYRLNNNYPSRYARRIMTEHPEWDGVFDVRELQA